MPPSLVKTHAHFAFLRREFNRSLSLAARRMLAQVEKLGLQPDSLGADKAYGSGEFLAWLLVRDIQPPHPGHRSPPTYIPSLCMVFLTPSHGFNTRGLA